MRNVRDMVAISKNPHLRVTRETALASLSHNHSEVARGEPHSRMSFPRRARMGPCGNTGAYYSRIGNTRSIVDRPPIFVFLPRVRFHLATSFPFSLAARSFLRRFSSVSSSRFLNARLRHTFVSRTRFSVTWFRQTDAR